MNILVTGANGQLGQSLKAIIDKHGNGEPHHFVHDKNYWMFAGHEDLDITDAEQVNKYIKENYISIVINCAAYTNVDEAEDNAELAEKINAIGPKNLAEACKEHGAVLIHISTDYVFNGGGNKPYTPKDNCSPIGEYGKSKFLGELHIVNSECKYLIFRTSWLYSPFGKNFVKGMADRLIKGQHLKVVDDQIGRPTSALSLAAFLYHIIEDFDSNNRYLYQTGIYHFADRDTCTWFDLTCEIAKILKKKKLINEYTVERCSSVEYKTKATRPPYSVLDTSSTEDTFEVKLTSWTKLVEATLNMLYPEEGNYREQLEMENTEFDYGHNIEQKSEGDE